MSEGPLAGVVVESLPKPYFEFMVTGDTVTNGKPHPEAYLTAVERLRLNDPSVTIDTASPWRIPSQVPLPLSLRVWSQWEFPIRFPSRKTPG